MLDVCSSASCILLLACRYRVRGDNISFTIKVRRSLEGKNGYVGQLLQTHFKVYSEVQGGVYFLEVVYDVLGVLMIDIYVYVNLSLLTYTLRGSTKVHQLYNQL